MSGRLQEASGGRARLGAFAVLALLVGVAGWLAAEEESPEALYARANALYTEGAYAEAISIYRALVGVAPNNGHLLYNLGNAHYKDGQLGKAILRYEQASRLLARDEDVRFNLRMARSRAQDKIDVPKNPLLQALGYGQRLLTIDEQTVLVFALYLSVAAMLLIRIVAPRPASREIFAKAFIPALAMLLILGLSLGAKLYAQRAVKEGILIVPEATVRSGPGEDFTEVFVVHEGTKARLRNARDRWVQISLPNGLNGWIPSKKLEPL